MSRRGIRGPVAGAAAVLLVAGCAQGTGGSDDAPSFGGEPEENLSVMGFGTGDEIGQVRFDRASAALEGTTIELSEGELDIQAFLSSVASGNPPDLINASRDQIGTFASRGAILSLEECVEAEGIDTSAFVEGALAQVTFEDEVYAIPEFNVV